jgi:hypothetical protein
VSGAVLAAVALLAAGAVQRVHVRPLAGRPDRRFHGWSIAALVLFAVAAVLGTAGGRRPRHARLVAQNGGPVADVRRLLDDPLSRAANFASGAIVLAILALMVWQP